MTTDLTTVLEYICFGCICFDTFSSHTLQLYLNYLLQNETGSQLKTYVLHCFVPFGNQCNLTSWWKRVDQKHLNKERIHLSRKLKLSRHTLVLKLSCFWCIIIRLKTQYIFIYVFFLNLDCVIIVLLISY